MIGVSHTRNLEQTIQSFRERHDLPKSANLKILIVMVVPEFFAQICTL